MSKGSVNVEDGKLKFALDTNEDGQPVINGHVNLSEALQEAFKKGGKIEGAKVVDVEFNLTKLVITIDTDKDGEELATIEIDLAEGVDEGTGLFKK